MASCRLIKAVENHLASIHDPLIFIALSGGIDSVSLAHALHHACKRSNKMLQAIHVDHGLQDYSKTAYEHVQTLMQSWGIKLHIHHLTPPQNLKSPETWARAARYDALFSTVQPKEALFLAHHENDQAETVLYRLMRGTGIKGLSGMQSVSIHTERKLIRPWLNISKDDIAQYADQHQLTGLDDPSNASMDMDRNWLRHHALPMFESRWPKARKQITQAAKHCEEADRAIQYCLMQMGLVYTHQDPLPLEVLYAQPKVIQQFMLRAWLPVTPTKIQLEALFNEVITAQKEAQPCLKLSDIEVRRFQDKLYCLPSSQAVQSISKTAWTGENPILLSGQSQSISQQDLADLGLDLSAVDWSKTYWRNREDGDRCKPDGREKRHSFKVLCQEAGIPPWQRPYLPILCEQERILCVYPFWVCNELFS